MSFTIGRFVGAAGDARRYTANTEIEGLLFTK